jgi:hypothetical protein
MEGSRRALVARGFAVTLALATVGVAMAVNAVSAPPAGVIALVDGTAITREQFDEYAAVFTSPDGLPTAKSRDVLLSLINQAVVHAHIADAGLRVDEADVFAQVGITLKVVPSGAPSLARAGGVEGLTRRVRAFLEMSTLRTAVLATAPGGDPTLNSPGQAEPRARADEIWETWLRRARECAVIEVVDPSLGVASSRPAFPCRVEP